MKKIFFSICLLMLLCMQGMERQFPESRRGVEEIFQTLFSEFLPPKESNDRVILALTESRMNGLCNAIKDKDIVKLEFSDIDPQKNKKYVCAIQSANRKIVREVEDFYALSTMNCNTNNWNQYELLLKKKLLEDPFMDISEEDQKNVQIGRFIGFSTNYDIYETLKEEENQLYDKPVEFIEIQNSKQLKLERTKAQVPKIAFNRFRLQSAFAAEDQVLINEARKKELHITPYVSLLEYIKNLRKAAVTQTNK